MPYYRRKRVYYKKRRYVRKNLKKSTIFSRKSAKAQAKQIYALNKKVNYIQKMTKPELYIYENMESNTLSGGYSPYTGTTYQGSNVQYGVLNEIMNNDQTKFAISGSLARVQSINLICSFVRTAACVNHLDTIGRITIMRQKKAIGGDVRIHNTNNYLISKINPVVYGCLKSDCTEWGKIIYDKKFKMKKDIGGLDRVIKINLKPFTLRLRTDSNGTPNKVSDYEYLIAVSMGHIGTQANGDDITFRCGIKVAYIDDNFDASSSKSRIIKDINPKETDDDNNYDIIAEKKLNI